MKEYFYRVLLGSSIGLVAGLSVSIFLYSLNFATIFFSKTPDLLYLLPVAGSLTLWLYKRYGLTAQKGSHLLIEECHTPHKTLPLIMAPLIFITTIIAHLAGASVGREASAVQISASLSDWISSKLHIVSKERKRSILIAAMGAGFSAAIGAPLAGMIFGFEVLQRKGFKVFALIESLVASFVAFAMTQLLYVPHTQYPQIEFTFSFEIISTLILSGILYGVVTRMFIQTHHLMNTATSKILGDGQKRIIIGSLLLIILFKLEGTQKFNGLGLSEIVLAFDQDTSWTVPFLKLAFTTLALAIGFRGGEFTPLAYIGATAGSSLAGLLSLSPGVFAATGFASIFAAAAKTPLACSFMVGELFGHHLIPYALLTCYLATWTSSHHSIYRHQI